jgi:hypothetical protein
MWRTPRRVRTLIPVGPRRRCYEADGVGCFMVRTPRFAHRHVRRQHHEHNAARSFRQHRPGIRPGSLKSSWAPTYYYVRSEALFVAASTYAWAGGRQLNDVLSVGLHRVWKRAAIKWSGATVGDCVLDVCCGSGDLALRLASVVGPTGAVCPPWTIRLFLGDAGRSTVPELQLAALRMTAAHPNLLTAGDRSGFRGSSAEDCRTA